MISVIVEESSFALLSSSSNDVDFSFSPRSFNDVMLIVQKVDRIPNRRNWWTGQ